MGLIDLQLQKEDKDSLPNASAIPPLVGDRGDKEGLRWRWREEETGSRCSTSTLSPADCINRRRNNERTTETGNGESGAALFNDQYVAGSWSISSLAERTGNNGRRGGVNESHLKSDTFFVSEPERRARIRAKLSFM